MDIVLMPVSWILVAATYAVDVSNLIDCVDQVIKRLRHEAAAGGGGAAVDQHSSTSALLDAIHDRYSRLSEQAVRVNDFSAPILFILAMQTAPLVCFALFIVIYSDFLALKLFVPIIAGSFVLLLCTLLSIAASITAKSDRLHRRLAVIAAAPEVVSLKQRIRISLMMEVLGSDRQPLALVTLSGERYTCESLMHFVLKTMEHYLLLLTFDSYFHFH